LAIQSNKVADRWRQHIWLALLFLLLTVAGAARGEAEFLAPEKAFRMSAAMIAADTAEVRFEIAPGYYMYRERFAFASTDATLGRPVFPAGEVHFEEVFQQKMETYRGSVSIRLPVTGANTFTLNVTSQGCSDRGLCYPPKTSAVTLTRSNPTGAANGQSAAAGGLAAPDAGEDGYIERALRSGRLLVILPMFLLLGLGLAFTPCVLPMMPILSSIIVGQTGTPSRLRGLMLSLVYSLGMAIVYSLMGIAAGLAGHGLAAALQNAWVLGAFALLMAALSLSMFGVFELQMPAAIQARLANTSNRQSAAGYAGVFIMGALSALIVGPCVAAPLAGALVYISQTKDALIGGSALFSMAIGMSVPLLLIGVSAGALLPRAGPWMIEVRRFFGVLMLGTALWIASPVLAPRLQMLGWALIGIGYAIALLVSRRRSRATSAIAVIAVALGGAQLAGLALGGTDPFAPFAQPKHSAQAQTRFQRVASVQELDAALKAAQGKTVMLDFYADWCVSCKEMERSTFADARVHARLANMVLLQVDVTANSEADQQMLKRFGLFGPPGIVFFGADAAEIRNTRVIGFQNADKFLNSLAAVEATMSKPVSNQSSTRSINATP